MQRTYEVTMEGFTPMLLNILKPERLDKANKPKRGEADKYEMENWRDKMLVEDGFVAFPSEYLERMLEIAASQEGSKIPGKQGATYTKYFKSSVFVVEPTIRTNVKADTVKPFIKAANGNPTAKKPAMILRYRPAIPDGWKAKCQLTVTCDLISEDILKSTARYGGSYVGLGDWRPKFGRAKVTIKAI